MRRMRWRAPLFAAAGAAICAACSLLTDFDGFDAPKPTADAGGPEGAGPEGGPEDPCPIRRRWPEAPDGGKAGDLGTQVAAMKRLSVIDDGGVPYGFDLDGLCSCPERVACVGAKANAPCDPLRSGIDNASRGFLSLFSVATGTNLEESGLALGLKAGKYSVVFRLAGWNGEPDDPDVALQVLNAFDANGGDAGASFDGGDSWTIDLESLADNRFPTSPVTRAYVASGTLVAELPVLVLKSRIPTTNDRWLLVRLPLRNARITARISRSGDGFSLVDGQVGGRIPASDLLASISVVGGCPGSPNFDAVKPFVCDARDLPVDPGKDGRDQACEAISFGATFEASPARVGAEAGAPSDELPCGDAAAPVDCR